jgi:hypothetical protein
MVSSSVGRHAEPYPTAELMATKSFYHFQDSWPSTTDIGELSCLSLFIFAATSIKFIGDANYGNPAGQLAKLRSSQTAIEGSSPYHHLDQLYLQVFNHVYQDITFYLVGWLKLVLGDIILLTRSTVPNLEHLVNMNSETADYSHSPVQRRDKRGCGR